MHLASAFFVDFFFYFLFSVSLHSLTLFLRFEIIGFQCSQIEYMHWISPSLSVKCFCYESNQICTLVHPMVLNWLELKAIIAIRECAWRRVKSSFNSQPFHEFQWSRTRQNRSKTEANFYEFTNIIIYIYAAIQWVFHLCTDFFVFNITNWASCKITVKWMANKNAHIAHNRYRDENEVCLSVCVWTREKNAWWASGVCKRITYTINDSQM